MSVVVRAAVLWMLVLVVMRAMGRKELSQLSPFEFVLLVVIGDLIQQGVTQQDTSVTAAALAVGTLALLTVGASYLAFRWQSGAPAIEGTPVVIIQNGRIMRQVLDIERLTEDEVRDAAREQGIQDLREIRLGVLEADGAFSFIRFGPPAEVQGKPKHPRTE